jgi:hypothetical protein
MIYEPLTYAFKEGVMASLSILIPGDLKNLQDIQKKSLQPSLAIYIAP